MNSTQNLFILQCSYARLSSSINELEQISQPDDQFILLEDTVHALPKLLSKFSTRFYILESDANFLPQEIKDQLKVINYSEFATLIYQAKKVITWK